jgi:hypothetical protein
MLNWKLIGWALGLTFAVSFVLCVAWGLLMPEPTHMHAFLELVLPGFRWLTVWGVLLGLVESFLWGFYFSLVFVPIHNWLYRKWN